ncbi:DUF4244 domain-containing protein [Promicromonospora iranensis]|uniref:DUF4244 domain-containing protein n=1 Tax=Promicromonospora iranensis TaxID=1105144 RepID=A0ABU2CNN7_9MICO|nr:DUF4244 domain-containing protein [Promicromonospora iranensis]MDR7382958.1 hypothetical protein [Promicromonospora iranensis]
MTTKTAVASPEPEDRAESDVDERESERGLATAEYAIATIAAAGFAGALMVILKGGDVKAMLTSLVQSALTIG